MRTWHRVTSLSPVVDPRLIDPRIERSRMRVLEATADLLGRSGTAS